MRCFGYGPGRFFEDIVAGGSGDKLAAEVALEI